MENKAKQIIEKFNDHPFSVTSMEGFEMANAYLQLKSALELANAEKIGLLQLIDGIETENKKLADENARLRAALAFYATGRDKGLISGVEFDKESNADVKLGKIASEALNNHAKPGEGENL